MLVDDLRKLGLRGTGTARLCRQRAIVDFAVQWMNANRPGSLNA